MSVPPALLPPFPAFDGAWNVDVQNARRKRDKEQRKRDGWWSKMTSGERPELPMIKELRPNLMLYSMNGGVSGKVHVVTSDGVMRDSLVVAEGYNGSVGLSVYTSPGQPLRVYAVATNGSVNIKIPSSFQGALTAHTVNGSIKLSDGIKSKLTTFSSTPNSTRCFIGDWQASHFGGPPSVPTPTTSHPGPSVLTSAPLNIDPFQTWTGSSLYLSSANGSVSLSWEEEDVVSALTSGFTRAVKSLINGIFGGGESSTSTSASAGGNVGSVGRTSAEASQVPGGWGAAASSSRNDGPSGSHGGGHGGGGSEWPEDSKRTDGKGYSGS
ncbi:hypothetical protein BDV93DRAFT_527045 [Ceratobasidium sp. AG-I]|nr:hypothetical protein BDV93DRAFT_527045 [Ceratobasidium sp. AG-I]